MGGAYGWRRSLALCTPGLPSPLGAQFIATACAALRCPCAPHTAFHPTPAPAQVLAWLSILAAANAGAAVGSLVSVESIVREHWRAYGRNVYCRYDYEGVASEAAEVMMTHLRGLVAGGAAAAPRLCGGYSLASADEFTYTDPVDGSVSARQGLRFAMADGSRVVYRLSGTGSVGATVRVYIERYEPDASRHDVPVAEALADLVRIATVELASMEKLIGRTEPTVIT